MATTFPGGTSVSRLSVYQDPGPDGLAGGSPHMHLASTEAYLVVEGSGALQTIGPDGFHETPLEAGSVVWFTPGTIHRSIAHGPLEVIVLMANSGLPEAGDAVLTFPAPELDPERYGGLAALPGPEAPYDERAVAAAARRDRAVTGFLELRAAMAHEGRAALERFYDAAVRLVGPRLGAWPAVLDGSSDAQAARSRTALEALEVGSWRHLLEAEVRAIDPVEGVRFGMCGLLRPYDVDAREADSSARARDVTP